MTAQLWWKSLAAWAAMAVLAIGNGVLRQALFVPALGEPIARPLSAVTMLAIVYLLTFVFLNWAGRPRGGVLWAIGLAWVALTVVFESALGVFMRGMSAAEIVATFNPLAPTFWFFVVVGTLIAPPVVGALMRGMAAGAAP